MKVVIYHSAFNHSFINSIIYSVNIFPEVKSIKCTTSSSNWNLHFSGSDWWAGKQICKWLGYMETCTKQKGRFLGAEHLVTDTRMTMRTMMRTKQGLPLSCSINWDRGLRRQRWRGICKSYYCVACYLTLRDHLKSRVSRWSKMAQSGEWEIWPLFHTR